MKKEDIMIKKVVIVIIAVVVTMNLVLNLFDITTKKKIGYVRSQDLVYGYTGMKEMQLKFQDQLKIWEANVDTLNINFQRSVTMYQQNMDKLTKEERMAQERMLDAQRSNAIQYSKNIEQKTKEEEEKLLQGVLNQVNSFVEGYGKDNGYDLILGTTLSGSILYGEDAIDLTEEITLAINTEYEGS